MQKNPSSRKLVVDDGERMTLNEVYNLYENGKHRRYTLLFAVNGGAFAIVSFLLKGDTNQETLPLLLGIGPVMALFSAAMGFDIDDFGKKLRNFGGALELFGGKGRLVLLVISLALVAVWLAAAAVGASCILIPAIPA
jgi:hypothetical protein